MAHLSCLSLRNFRPGIKYDYLQWDLCPDADDVTVDEGTVNQRVMYQDSSTPLNLQATCNALGCSDVSYSFSTYPDFSLRALLYFDMEDGVTDVSGNNRDGSTSGSPSYSSSTFRYGSSSIKLVTGEKSINVDSGLSLNESSGTVAFYMRPTWSGSETGAEERILSTVATEDGERALYVVFGEAELFVRLESATGSTNVTLVDAPPFYANVWVHFALTYTVSGHGAALEAFFDGTSYGSGTASWGENSIHIYDAFDSFDSSIWDSQPSGSTYSGGILTHTGNQDSSSTLMRTVKTFSGANGGTVIKALIDNESGGDCTDQTFQICTSGDMGWDWAQVSGCIRMVYQCNSKIMYGELETIETAATCTYGSTEVTITITENEVTWSDDSCPSVSMPNTGIGASDFYVYIGSDDDDNKGSDFYWICVGTESYSCPPNSVPTQTEFGGSNVDAYLDEVIAYDMALLDTELEYVLTSDGVSDCIGSASRFDSPFILNSTTGAVSVGSKQLRYDKCGTYYMTVLAEADNASLGCTFPVEIDDVNDAPVLRSEHRFSVAERTSKETYVGDPLNATDVDFGQTILFSINTTIGDGGDPVYGSDFGIGKCSGHIYVNTNNLDYNAKSFYSLFINVVDDGSPAKGDSGWVHINVTNVNDAPYFAGPWNNFTFKENSPNRTGTSKNPWKSVLRPTQHRHMEILFV